MAAQQFNTYLNNLYRCTNAAIQGVRLNQLINIRKYSCRSSEWIKYFGESGELDFTCEASGNALSSGWCTIIQINGHVIQCRNQFGNYHLQIAPCSNLEGISHLPQYG